MKNVLIILIVTLGLIFTACTKKTEAPEEVILTENPFFSEYNTPFKVPPFDRIKPEHFIPAYERGMEEHKADIEAIINDSEEPNFDNTIGALDRSGKLLSEVSRVFSGLSG
jgi:peptidyl-dipeptidase Dcp